MSLKKISTDDIVRKQSTFKQTVYKSAIESPFNIKWPRVQAQLSSRLLDNLLKTLQPVGEFRKASRLAKSRNKEDKVSIADIPNVVSEHRLLVGINEVTKHLEQLIQKNKTDQDVHMGETTDLTMTPTIFLCRRDIRPVHLCSHLLTMAALANIKLVPLPLDAENLLSTALDLHRVSVVYLEVCDSEAEEPLRLAVNEVPAVEAPWMTRNMIHSNHYSTTRIKVLKTTGTFTKKSK